MKTQKISIRSTIFLISLFLSHIGFIGCSNSDDSTEANSNCLNWTEQFLAQANAYSEASEAYTNDPTPVNCQSFKAAGLNYIASLEDVVDCVPTANRQAFLADLNEYRDEVNSVDCN